MIRFNVKCVTFFEGGEGEWGGNGVEKNVNRLNLRRTTIAVCRSVSLRWYHRRRNCVSFVKHGEASRRRIPFSFSFFHFIPEEGGGDHRS